MSTTVTNLVTQEYTSAQIEAEGVVFMVRLGQYLYCLTDSNPAELTKINRNDFTDRTTVTFANDGAHASAAGLVPHEESGKLYALFGGGQFTITEIDGDSLARTDKVSVADVNVTAGADALAVDSTSIYVLYRLDDDAQRLTQYLLSDFSSSVFNMDGYACGNSLRYSNGHLFCVDFTNPTTVLLKISVPSFAIVDTQDFPTPVAGRDFMAITDSRVFVGTLEDPNIYYFEQSNLTVGTVTISNATDRAAVDFDGVHVWSLFVDGKAQRINAQTLAGQSYTLNAGQGYINRLVAVGQLLYVSFYGTPTIISRYRVIPYGSFQWVQTPRTAQDDYVNCVAIDSDGNICVGGSLGGNIFFAKYTPAGVLAFPIKQFGSGTVYGIAVDDDGSIFITGYYQGSANFGGDTLAGSGYADIYVCKFDADGNHVWSTGFRGATDEEGKAIALDASGNVYVTGFISSAVDFGFGLRTPAGGSAIFVLKLNSSGVAVWDKVYGSAVGGTAHSGNGIAVDPSGNILVAGWFAGPLSFGGSTFTTVGQDAFILKLQPSNGAHIWSRQINATTLGAAYGITAFSNGDAGVIGAFYGSANLGGGTVQSTGQRDIWFARYATADGAHVWSQKAGGEFGVNDYGFAITVDEDDNPFITGTTTGTASLGGGVSIGGNGLGAFIARLNPDTGIGIWGNTYIGQSNNNGRGIAANSERGVIGVGTWYSGVDFGDGVRTGIGSGEGYVLALST